MDPINDPTPVVVVKPGSSIFQYEADIEIGRWLVIRIHPMAFTFAGALLFCKQSQEERHNLLKHLRYSPLYKITVFYNREDLTKLDCQKAMIEFPKIGGLPHPYRNRSFKDEVKRLEEGIKDIDSQLQALPG